MNNIIRATENDAELLVTIGTASFLDSHGHSAAKKDIDAYVDSKFNLATFSEELRDLNNYFYILYHNQIPAGYSKVIFNCAHSNIAFENVTKMERLYLLKEFHFLKLGLELFNFNKEASIKNNQAGMWLFVWTENAKAINFYNKAGFKIIGSHNFKISENHYNPNHQLLLTY